MTKLNETIVEDAAEWVVLLDDSSATEQMHQDFYAWVTASPAHAEAFELPQTRWGELDTLLPLASVEDMADQAQLTESENIEPKHMRSGRGLTRLKTAPMWMKSAAGFGLATRFAFMLFLVPNPKDIQPPEIMYQTAIGEVDSIVLPDDSTMFINSATHLTVKFSNQSRIVNLIAGEAHFDVATDAERPFSVIAGGRVVQAIGTAFSVRHTELDDVIVTVSEGRVLMRDHVDAAAIEDIVQTSPKLAIEADKPSKKQTAFGGTAATETILRAGDRLDVSDDRLSLISDIPLDRLERDLAWRHGGLILDRDQLQDVIGVMSLYTDAEIIIKDADLRGLEVGGYFKIDDIDSMLSLLEAGLDVDVERVSESLIEIRSR